jgi:tripartite-type tricarboxylate transporter receptor subunit TctC
MKLPRRRFLHLAAGASVLPAVSRIAWAQTYPTRPVRLIVGYPPGGPTDIAARLIGQWLSDHLAQPFVIENRPGANTNLATEAVVRAQPDGYTLLVFDTSPTISATYYDKLKFDFVRDIAPVASIVRQPVVLVVNPSFAAKTVPEFIAYAKANPGKLNMASAGTGTGGHVSGELFKMQTGVNMIHVPYRGAALALTDLIGGQVQFMFAGLLGAIEYIKSGRLRTLAVTSATRSESLPDIPSLSELLPAYVADDWKGIGAPKDTPVEIINKLNKEISAALADPTIKTKIADLGGVPLMLSPVDFAKLIAAETEKWAKVVKFAGIKAD